MSYDRIWLCQQMGAWVERRDAYKREMHAEFDADVDRLHCHGHFVVLVAGKNLAFDEIFLFERASDAKAFYDFGYQEWESFADDSDEGCGFQEVSLYKDGRQIATKDSAPTHFSEACNE